MTRSLKPTRCKVHHKKLEKTRVKIVYGLITRTPKVTPAYVRARSTQFPHVNDVVMRGCVVRPEKSRIRMTCADCIAARDEWLKLYFSSWAESNDLDGL